MRDRWLGEGRRSTSSGIRQETGAQAWIDPKTKRVYILMVQRANFPNSDASEVRKGFQEAASSAFANLKSK
jgi:hypothetical protein